MGWARGMLRIDANSTAAKHVKLALERLGGIGQDDEFDFHWDPIL
jgi:hypothetical protein